jgi:hypothetical protein
MADQAKAPESLLSAVGPKSDDKSSVTLKPAENVTVHQRISSSPRRTVEDTYEYRFKDGRTHICKNPHCPQMRTYSKVISGSSIISDHDNYKYYTYQPKYETEYVVSDAQQYKTYSYVEPKVEVDLVPAHVERVEITEIAQGIDERIRYKEPVVEKVVEKIVEVRRPVVEPIIEKVVEVKKPVVEVFTHPHEVYTYAVVDESPVQDSNEYFYYATDDDRRVEVVETRCVCDHHCLYHQPLHYK